MVRGARSRNRHRRRGVPISRQNVQGRRRKIRREPSHIILDSEALNASAHPKDNEIRSRKVLSTCIAAAKSFHDVIVPPLVVTELCRGKNFDPAVRNAIRSHQLAVPILEFENAISVGNLLGKANLENSHVIDATAVAIASQIPGSVIMTGDKKDMEYLVDHTETPIRVIAI